MGKIVTLRYLGLLLAAAVSHASDVPAANFKATTDPDKTCSAIEIDGDIRPGDYERFAVTLGDATALAPLRRLYLNSGGGDLVTALAITELIRNTASGMDSIVQSRHGCNSACVVLLTAGSRHNVSADAEVIIHQVFNERTGKRDAEMTKRLGQYLALNGMPPDVIWTMSGLKPDELLAITPSNANRLGFSSFNFYGGTNAPATPQCSWDGFIASVP